MSALKTEDEVDYRGSGGETGSEPEQVETRQSVQWQRREADRNRQWGIRPGVNAGKTCIEAKRLRQSVTVELELKYTCTGCRR